MHSGYEASWCVLIKPDIPPELFGPQCVHGVDPRGSPRRN
jgi:hypothetical protein